MHELRQSLVADMYPPTPLFHGLSSLGSTHRLHPKPAPGQDVGHMLWRGAPEHACGARPCLQTGIAPPKTGVLWSCGPGGGGVLRTCAADCIDTVLSLSPWGCWLGHRESPLEPTQSPVSGTLPCYLLVPGTYQHCQFPERREQRLTLYLATKYSLCWRGPP